jgi:hypothetical protein
LLNKNSFAPCLLLSSPFFSSLLFFNEKLGKKKITSSGPEPKIFLAMLISPHWLLAIALGSVPV